MPFWLGVLVIAYGLVSSWFASRWLARAAALFNIAREEAERSRRNLVAAAVLARATGYVTYVHVEEDDGEG